jgi:UDPglucose--hexose-1-phosphate uridylyltransferase
MSELRFDPLTGRPVLIAENRLARPNEHGGRAGADAVPSDCPFCEGREDRTPPEIVAVRPEGGRANGPGWIVRVIPNKFPSLAADAPEAAAPDSPLFRRAPGFGYHEVLIESPRHGSPFPDLPTDQRRTVVRVARDRVRALAEHRGIRGVLLFENAGPESGGTLWHPHAQLVATPIDLPRVEEELRAVRARRTPTSGRCPVEEILEAEERAGVRRIAERGGLVAVAPYASALPYEVRIVPRRHFASFAEATDAETEALAELLAALLRALVAEAPRASYNWFAASLPPSHPDRSLLHWQLTVAPRLVRPDGFEIGGGIEVNPVAPETAAARLRARVESPSPGA